MSYIITGLPLVPFQAWFGLSDAALAEHAMVRRIATSKPGFPCRITLEDAEIGDSLKSCPAA